MKYKKILRISGIAVILSLLVVAVPVAAQTRFIDLDPEEGKIGDSITIVGEGFNKSIDTDRYASIYFSSQEASTVHDIDDDVTRYNLLKEGVWLDEEGEFETTFTVPDELDDGDDEVDVEAGTYYVYVTHYPYVDIRAYAEFTIIGGEIEIDPDDGPAGTEVEVIGTEFSSEEDISIEYDGDEIDIEDGDDETDDDGEFLAVILIPESTAGDHTITVTVSGNEAEAEFTVEPEIFVDPLSGSANTTVSVSGTGFGRRQEVVIYFDNTGLATATTSTQGSFEAEFIVPDGLEADIYDVEVEDEDENTDTAKFTVTSAVPSPSPTPSPAPSPPISATTVSISLSSGPIGAYISAVGTGFEADSAVTIKYDDEELATIAADSNGMFVVAFEVPPSKYGDHTITLSDGTNTHELTFAVESTPPEVPSPLLPELGVNVKPPISFDWADVDDESAPVTYTLQVATSTDFSAASIVLEKEGLTESEYTVTEGEESRLVAQQTPYFWRVRAIDGASNEGDWTGPGTFYIAEAFALPDWLLYALAGLGGLLLFIVGYLLGRRTAYY